MFPFYVLFVFDFFILIYLKSDKYKIITANLIDQSRLYFNKNSSKVKNFFPIFLQ